MYDKLVKRLREPCQYENCVLCQDAADAIEELQQTAEHYKGCSDDWYKEACDYKAMLPRWIPVTERLPEERHPVLVTYLGYNDKLPKSDMVAMCDDGDWYWYYDESKCKVAITHWMPLPEPPKEET